MRSWMDFFIEYMTTKKAMSDAFASGGNPFTESLMDGLRYAAAR